MNWGTSGTRAGLDRRVTVLSTRARCCGSALGAGPFRATSRPRPRPIERDEAGAAGCWRCDFPLAFRLRMRTSAVKCSFRTLGQSSRSTCRECSPSARVFPSSLTEAGKGESGRGSRKGRGRDESGHAPPNVAARRLLQSATVVVPDFVNVSSDCRSCRRHCPMEGVLPEDCARVLSSQ